jgi:hypothetical protein
VPTILFLVLSYERWTMEFLTLPLPTNNGVAEYEETVHAASSTMLGPLRRRSGEAQNNSAVMFDELHKAKAS